MLAVTRDASYASSGDIGLSLAEAKNMLEYVQQEFVTAQAQELVERARVCPHCGHNRPAASSAMTGLGCLVIVVIIIYFIVHNWTR